MARFSSEMPYEIMSQLDELSKGVMFQEMLKESSKAVIQNILNKMRKVFKTTESIEEGLFVTKVYQTNDGAVNIFVGFKGYKKVGKKVNISTTKNRGKVNEKKYTYQRDGVPIALIAAAREYGTSSGEAKKPFFRQSFKKSEIENIMQSVQNRYIGG